MGARYFPVSLDLQGRRCVVIGAGREAHSKTTALLEAGAIVHLIGPEVDEATSALLAAEGVELVAPAAGPPRADTPRLTFEQRPYRPGDLAGAFLAFACTDVEAVNAAVALEGRRLGILLNVVDQPPRCNFIMPAVVRQGPLTLAITTDGNSPAMARRIKEELAEEFGEPYAEFLALMGSLRPGVKASGLPLATRSELYTRIVRSDAFDLLLAGDRAGMYRVITTVLKEYEVECPTEWSTWSALAPGTPIWSPSKD
jgi:precorrin-2 dehydrogenase/sirohydrochlorin ferrochelatase